MLRKFLWKIQVLFTRVPVLEEPTIVFKSWCKKPFWWCGYYVVNPKEDLKKVLREKYYIRYYIRGKQSHEFEAWIYYYLTFLWQYLIGRIRYGLSKKGAYCTCPMILESLFYENKSDIIYHAYPYGKWRKFLLNNRKEEWKKEKKRWKTYIRETFKIKI